MFDPVSYVKAKLAMRQAQQAVDNKLAAVLEAAATMQRARQIALERQLAEESDGYIELGDRNGRGDHGRY